MNIIPLPKYYIEEKGELKFKKSELSINCSEEFGKQNIEVFKKVFNLDFVKKKATPLIDFIFDKKEQKNSYSMLIDQNGIRIFSGGDEGMFYSVISLMQLLKVYRNRESDTLTAPFVKIMNDRPRYQWRGIQLDESRHFFGKETVKKILDMMSYYKLNVFHWHLTDDQGWRIEIEKYPLLTQKGSKRAQSQISNWNCTKQDGTPHSGFYTKDDIREIVAYAKERYINIVPEIDFPAHCLSAISAYPFLSCDEKEIDVPTYFGGKIPEKNGEVLWNKTLCLSKKRVYDFIYDVLDEVCELFPFEYFHIGGDEAPLDSWKNCDHCQEYMKKKGMKSERELQNELTRTLVYYLETKGKTAIVWNEALRGNPPKSLVCQYWTPKRDIFAERFINSGTKAIISNHKAFYFDMPHKKTKLKSTYLCDAKSFGIKKSAQKNILGIEGENWTEWTATKEELFFKLFLRMLALSENAWRKTEQKDFSGFLARLKQHTDCIDFIIPNEDIYLHKKSAKVLNEMKKHGISPLDFSAEFKLSKIRKNQGNAQK